MPRRKLTSIQTAKLKILQANGFTTREIANELNVSRMTVSRNNNMTTPFEIARVLETNTIEQLQPMQDRHRVTRHKFNDKFNNDHKLWEKDITAKFDAVKERHSDMALGGVPPKPNDYKTLVNQFVERQTQFETDVGIPFAVDRMEDAWFVVPELRAARERVRRVDAGEELEVVNLAVRTDIQTTRAHLRSLFADKYGIAFGTDFDSNTVFTQLLTTRIAHHRRAIEVQVNVDLEEATDVARKSTMTQTRKRRRIA